MLVVVKTPHIDLRIQGDIPQWMLTRLQKEYGEVVNISHEEDDDDELVDIFETTWFQELERKITPGENLRVYRENLGFTQEELGKRLGGIPRQHISDMERGKRTISKNMAKQFSQIFHVSVERFI
jgi:DNA-binding XRE family transcriptional regulator